MNNNSVKNVTPAKNAGLVSFFQKTYLYMTIALAITAISALIFARFFPQQIISLYGQRGVTVGLLTFAIQMFIIIKIQRWSSKNPSRAFGLLIAFSLINGISFSLYFMIFSLPSLFTTFLSTAALFGGMAIYGLVTKRDLSGMQPILFGVLFGFIIAALSNLFFNSSALQWILSFVGVILFSAFTAFDNNTLKSMYLQQEGRSASMTGLAISGALRLYLDFINLFTSLLNFTGSSRN